MALGGAIAWFRVAEFARLSVWTIVVVVDIDEVKADDPLAGVEDHPRLLNEKFVNDGFEFGRWDGVKLSERVFVRLRSTSDVGDGLDVFLVYSNLEKYMPDDPGGEGCDFDPWIVTSERRSSAKVNLRGRENCVWMVEKLHTLLQTLPKNLTSSVSTNS